jgi:hypothetical protein
MRKELLTILVMSLILSGCGLGIKKSGIEIISYPSSKVFIDDKEVGMSPYKNNSLTPGDKKIKLIIDGAEWSKTVHLENGANTVVNREINQDTNKNGGYLLYLESTGDSKKAGLLITTKPDRAAVAIDGEIKGFSPLRIEDIGEGDKQITLSFPGYKTIDMFIRSISGYQLVVEADLATEVVVSDQASTSEIKTTETKVKIKTTETGWLRVRQEADGTSEEIAKVKPNEIYTLLEEKDDWEKIDLENGKSGWISSKYADKL